MTEYATKENQEAQLAEYKQAHAEWDWQEEAIDRAKNFERKKNTHGMDYRDYNLQGDIASVKLAQNGSPICSGTDCVNPAFDATKKGPAISPQILPKKLVPNTGVQCDVLEPTLDTCKACCSTVPGQVGTGGVGTVCTTKCYDKFGG